MLSFYCQLGFKSQMRIIYHEFHGKNKGSITWRSRFWSSLENTKSGVIFEPLMVMDDKALQYTCVKYGSQINTWLVLKLPPKSLIAKTIIWDVKSEHKSMVIDLCSILISKNEFYAKFYF